MHDQWRPSWSRMNHSRLYTHHAQFRAPSMVTNTLLTVIVKLYTVSDDLDVHKHETHGHEYTIRNVGRPSWMTSDHTRCKAPFMDFIRHTALGALHRYCMIIHGNERPQWAQVDDTRPKPCKSEVGHGLGCPLWSQKHHSRRWIPFVVFGASMAMILHSLGAL